MGNVVIKPINRETVGKEKFVSSTGPDYVEELPGFALKEEHHGVDAKVAAWSIRKEGRLDWQHVLREGEKVVLKIPSLEKSFEIEHLANS